ncbi:MAG: hypothetical protein L0Z52_07400 [Acidobacteria bacterium]|nr:hypothetical protein [Acidobacteriota bacterium]
MTKKELIHRICRECAPPRLRRVARDLPENGSKKARSRRANSRKAALRRTG